MGKKLEALRWAMTTKPKSESKEDNRRHMIGSLYVPYRSDPSYLLYSLVMFIVATFILSKLILPTLLVFISWILATVVVMRASWKLGNEWVDENLEITIKWKQKSVKVS